jgi:hypothetical protein
MFSSSVGSFIYIFMPLLQKKTWALGIGRDLVGSIWEKAIK